MNPVVKNIVLAVVGLGALAGVAYMFMHKGKETVYPDTAESITTWQCEICGEVTRLTTRKMEEWMHSDTMVRRADPNAAKSLVDMKQTVFKCLKCNKFSICRAKECPYHKGVYVIEKRSDGSMGACPQCAKGSG